jgi:hypothetical protein
MLVFSLIKHLLLLLKELRCLLDAQNNKRVHLASKCAQLLIKRRELWNLAQVSDDITGIKDLVNTINQSGSRLYIFGVLAAIVFVIFLMGCTLRPAILRTKMDKLK